MIAGMSGRLPESENMQEFWANLIGGVDMVTDDDRRWKAGEWAALGLPCCSGCLLLLAAAAAATASRLPGAGLL